MERPYLMRRGEIFYFRRAVPFDLTPFFSCTEIWKSLRTRDRASALLRVRRLDSETDRVFTLIRSGALNRTEIDRVIKTYFRNLLDGFETHRLKGSSLYEMVLDSPIDTISWNEDFIPLGEATGFTRGASVSPLSIEHLIEHYEQKVAACKDHLRTRYIHPFLELKANGLISRLKADIQPYNSNDPEGFANHDPMPDDFRALCLELLKAEISAYEIEIERLRGNYNNAYDRNTEALMAPVQIVDNAVTLPTPAPTPAMPSIPLSAAISTYIDQKRMEGGRNDITLVEYEDACRLLEKMIGDKPINEVTRDDVRLYLKTIQQLPKNINKNPKTRDKSLTDAIVVAKEHNLPTLSPAAIKKKFQQIKGLLQWAQQENLLDRDISSGISYRPPKTGRRHNEERDAYTKGDLQGLVTGLCEEWKKGTFSDHPERYWVPLIGLFSGMRLEEICQLRTHDIKEENGVWCFDVNEFDEEGRPVKKLKTVNARRQVPIHPTLIRLGLLEHVSQTQKTGSPRLWDKLGKDSRGKYQRNIKDWYNGADNRPGFENIYISSDASKSFHSLRHTFINELKQRMADSRTISELAGHLHGTLSGDRYGKPLSVEVKFKAVEAIDYHGIDFIGRLEHITI